MLTVFFVLGYFQEVDIKVPDYYRENGQREWDKNHVKIFPETCLCDF